MGGLLSVWNAGGVRVRSHAALALRSARDFVGRARRLAAAIDAGREYSAYLDRRCQAVAENPLSPGDAHAIPRGAGIPLHA